MNALLDHNATQGFKARFDDLFDDDDLLMATTLHPHYKLVAVKNMTNSRVKADAIQQRLLHELMQSSNVNVPLQREEAQEHKNAAAAVEEDPFLQVDKNIGLR